MQRSSGQRGFFAAVTCKLCDTDKKITLQVDKNTIKLSNWYKHVKACINKKDENDKKNEKKKKLPISGPLNKYLINNKSSMSQSQASSLEVQHISSPPDSTGSQSAADQVPVVQAEEGLKMESKNCDQDFQEARGKIGGRG